MKVINEKMSFKIGVKFAALVYMGKDILDVLHVFIFKSTGNDL